MWQLLIFVYICISFYMTYIYRQYDDFLSVSIFVEKRRGKLRKEEWKTREISQTGRCLGHLCCNKYFLRGLQTIQRQVHPEKLNPFVVKAMESHSSPTSPLAPWALPQRVTLLNATERLNALKHNRHFSSKCTSRCECSHCAWPTRELAGPTMDRCQRYKTH